MKGMRTCCLLLAAIWLAVAPTQAASTHAAWASPQDAGPAQSGNSAPPAHNSPPQQPPVRVVASIYPISALIREVGGDRVEVSTIIPPEADPHHFELTPGKARAIHEAKVIMVIGGHFDEWLLPDADERETAYMVVRFNEAFTDSLIPLENSFNPHFWLDPMFAAEMTRIIAVALCTVDVDNCEYYRTRAAELIANLHRLRITGSERLATAGFGAFVAVHPAWTYFARRYGISEVATLEVSHESEPSARHIAEVIRKMTSNEVKFLVAEEFSNLALARSVADQTGAGIVLLDPLGSENSPGRSTYEDLINHNISVMERNAQSQKRKNMRPE